MDAGCPNVIRAHRIGADPEKLSLVSFGGSRPQTFSERCVLLLLLEKQTTFSQNPCLQNEKVVAIEVVATAKLAIAIATCNYWTKLSQKSLLMGSFLGICHLRWANASTCAIFGAELSCR